jgi:8-oxo-dGTP pyrophosphatase MutT (NUDIX family)
MNWKKLSSRTVWENDWMRVLEDEVTNPGGGNNKYGYVHFKNRAVAIIPLDRNDNVWLVGQERYTLNAWSWELPMGGAPLNEEPLEAAKRELKEETGLSARTWTEVMRLHPSNSITDELGIIYLAEDLIEGASEPEETEVIEVCRLPLDAAVAMVHTGEITDAISAAGLLRIATFKKAASP